MIIVLKRFYLLSHEYARYHLGKDDFEAMIGSGTASDPGLAFAFCKGDANNT
jgi:hypothetical protein